MKHIHLGRLGYLVAVLIFLAAAYSSYQQSNPTAIMMSIGQ